MVTQLNMDLVCICKLTFADSPGPASLTRIYKRSIEVHITWRTPLVLSFLYIMISGPNSSLSLKFLPSLVSVVYITCGLLWSASIYYVWEVVVNISRYRVDFTRKKLLLKYST